MPCFRFVSLLLLVASLARAQAALSSPSQKIIRDYSGEGKNVIPLIKDGTTSDSCSS